MRQAAETKRLERRLRSPVMHGVVIKHRRLCAWTVVPRTLTTVHMYDGGLMAPLGEGQLEDGPVRGGDVRVMGGLGFGISMRVGRDKERWRPPGGVWLLPGAVLDARRIIIRDCEHRYKTAVMAGGAR